LIFGYVIENRIDIENRSHLQDVVDSHYHLDIAGGNRSHLVWFGQPFIVLYY
jgi:glyoxylase-like metal-dependent hydrolase (beta-lactamase superfamily II)